MLFFAIFLVDSSRSTWWGQRSGRIDAGIGELFLVGRFEDLKGTHECIINRHHGTSIVKFTTVIGSGEKSDQLPLGKKFISILDHLMGTTDQVQVMFMEELGHDIGSKRVGDTTIILSPSHDILVGIGPKEVTK